jgi:hypothetical protein
MNVMTKIAQMFAVVWDICPDICPIFSGGAD